MVGVLAVLVAMVADSADVLVGVAQANFEIDFNLPGSPDPFGPLDGPGTLPPLFPGPGDGPPDAGPGPDTPPPDQPPDEDCEQ